MTFQEPEVVEMGVAGELIKIAGFSNNQENPPDPEPTWDPTPVFVLGEK